MLYPLRDFPLRELRICLRLAADWNTEPSSHGARGEGADIMQAVLAPASALTVPEPP